MKNLPGIVHQRVFFPFVNMLNRENYGKISTRRNNFCKNYVYTFQKYSFLLSSLPSFGFYKYFGNRNFEENSLSVFELDRQFSESLLTLISVRACRKAAV